MFTQEKSAKEKEEQAKLFAHFAAENARIQAAQEAQYQERVKKYKDAQQAASTQTQNSQSLQTQKTPDYSAWDEMVRNSQAVKKSQMEKPEQDNKEITDASQMEKLDEESEDLVTKILGVLTGSGSSDASALELLKVLPPPILIKPKQDENPEYRDVKQEQSWFNEFKATLMKVADALNTPNAESIAFTEARIKALATAEANTTTNHQERCLELNQLSDKELSSQYLLVGIQTYNFLNLNFRSSLKGTMIHRIAAEVAQKDMNYSL